MNKTAESKLSCLVIDNNADEADRIAQHIAGIRSSTISSKLATDFEKGLAEFKSGRYTVCFLGDCTNPQNGLAPLNALRETGVQTPIVLLGPTDRHFLDDSGIPLGIFDIVGWNIITPALLARIIRHARKSADTSDDRINRRLGDTETLRTQATIMKKAFDHQTRGIAIFDRHGVLSTCNTQYLAIYGFSSDIVKPGIAIKDILNYSVSLGNYTEEQARRAMAVRVAQIETSKTSSYVQHLRDGRSIAVIHQPIAEGGSMTVCEAVTRSAEDARGCASLT